MKGLAFSILASLFIVFNGCIEEDSNSWPRECVELNDLIQGKWQLSTNSSVIIQFDKVNSVSGITQGIHGTREYGITTDCDAITIIGEDGYPIITYNARLLDGWLELENWSKLMYYRKVDEPAPPPPPSLLEVSLSSTYPVSIELWEQIYWPTKTGAGAFTGMKANPSDFDWDGTVVKERVEYIDHSDICGIRSPNFDPCLCEDSDGALKPCDGTFEFGKPFPNTPQGIADAEHNIFWDIHKVTNKEGAYSSLLHLINKDFCSCQCKQDYLFNGKIVGSFVITYEFSKDDVNGVTRVTVRKQRI